MAPAARIQKCSTVAMTPEGVPTAQTGSLEEELAALKSRVQQLEDTVAIYQLVATYGPSVDGGVTPEAGLLWAEDGWYDTDIADTAPQGTRGRDAINAMAEMVGGLPIGAAHLTTLPMVKVDGDRAVAVNHSSPCVTSGDDIKIMRISSNRWELERIDGRWQIRVRTNRALDGTDGPKDVFRQGVKDTFVHPRERE
jgi:hypothetical protein